MKEFFVKIPIAGWIGITIEAESEDEAKEKAFESNIDLNNCEDSSYDIYDHITQGNVFYGEINSVEVEEVEE